MLSISIFGLGYVGSVAAGCLANQGCRVIGVDVHSEKIARINAGRAPIHEPGLDELLQKGIAAALLSATDDVTSAVQESDVSVICVGTPCDDAGALDLTFVKTVTTQIRDALGEKEHHRIIFRSTMLPGSTRSIVAEILQDLVDSGRIDVFFFPEFLRQGAAVQDYQEPSLSVLGAYDQSVSIDTIRILFTEDTEITDLETAELLKYGCNAFHAAKVTFANEIGRIGKHLQIDSRRVMELLCKDERLNISPSYLRPGNPFGGSCLPKDVSALNVFAESHGIEIPTLRSLIPSNEQHLEHLRALVHSHPGKEAIIVGLAFKHDTDDLRGSALLQLAVDLLNDGYELRIFDPLLDPDAMIGASKMLVEQKLPSLADLMKPTLSEALGDEGTILASNRCISAEIIQSQVKAGHKLIDVSGWPELASIPNSEGICW